MAEFLISCQKKFLDIKDIHMDKIKLIFDFFKAAGLANHIIIFFKYIYIYALSDIYAYLQFYLF